MIEFKLNNPLVGFALTKARDGGQVKVATSEFLSSEDGDQLIHRLEEVSRVIFSSLPNNIHILESSIDHLLVIIKRDATAELYVNELPISLIIKTKKGFEKGEFIYEDDIADIDKLELGRDVSEDAGFIFVFSKGWRKALFYDFHPLCPEKPDRNYDIKKTLGSYYAYLSFQHLFKIEEGEFTDLFSQGWFPFLAIKHSSLRQMLNHLRAGWSVDELLPQIAKELLDNLDQMMGRWEIKTEFKSHLPFFEEAIKMYKDDHHISATSILYTRIEGLLRSCFDQSIGKPHQDNLARSLSKRVDKGKTQTILFLPKMFEKYLVDVYFKDFKPREKPPITKHSVGHGVAEAEDFTLKSATIGFLIIDQIYYHLP